MELLDPEQRIRNQKVSDFILPIIKYLGSPVRMLPLLRVGIFISRGTVKVGQSMDISGKMSRNPVQDHANLILMKVIDHPCKIFRRSITGSRCEIARHLISPGAIKRVFRNPHQFNMRVSHVLYILGDLFRKFPVIIESLILPAQMPFP